MICDWVRVLGPYVFCAVGDAWKVVHHAHARSGSWGCLLSEGATCRAPAGYCLFECHCFRSLFLLLCGLGFLSLVCWARFLSLLPALDPFPFHLLVSLYGYLPHLAPIFFVQGNCMQSGLGAIIGPSHPVDHQRLQGKSRIPS